MTDGTDSRIPQFENALARGDMRGIRSALLELTPADRDVLEARLGVDAVARLFANTRRAARAGVRGKVVAIHGIMGGRLDVVSGGDTDRVWLNYFRLILGRIADLRLPVGGEAPPPKVRVQVAGMLPEYLPLVTELGTQWDVLPFAYDWRDDLDKASDDLAQRIERWRNGQPVHLVAHSMGGLVSRWFIRKHRDLWKAMQDPSGLKRGGRLVMLGTPNRGSFAIPLVLSGEEKTVKILELCDAKHDMPELLDILGTFLGCYQMLPSHCLEFGDDRLALWDRETWGRLPVRASLLDRARQFHDDLFEVLDPERLVYIAGYDRPTPYRIRVDKPGKFSYLETLDGDGRVPHELGLLDNVRTLYVDETHGDLQRNAAVLDGIHELLSTGDTNALERSRPASRAARVPAVWRPADAMDPVPEEVLASIAKAVNRGVKRAVSRAKPEEAARIEAELASGFVGAGGATRGGAARPRRSSAPPPAPSGPLPKLRVEVVWGDITKVDGDVYACGHYQNVLPQAAELQLDRVVSPPHADRSSGVLTSLTRRGVLRGALGDVYFYPWAERGSRRRMVAIAGMGHPGTFGAAELRSLARNLTLAVTSLPDARTVCTVLIGGGVGNLEVASAVDGLIAGMVSAIPLVDQRAAVTTLKIVEYKLSKAIRIHRLLRATLNAHADKVAFRLRPTVAIGRMHIISKETSLVYALAAATTAAKRTPGSTHGRALTTLLGALPNTNQARAKAREVLEEFAPRLDGDVRELAERLTVDLSTETGGTTPGPTRISFISGDNGITVAAISDTAVIPVRFDTLDDALVEEAIRDMTDPPVDRVAALSRLLARLVLPRDFRDLLKTASPFTFEVDRKTARIRWEMIARSVETDEAKPLSLEYPVARQLRTSYSPPPTSDYRTVTSLSALVIGDPGDPDLMQSLDGARTEALAVRDTLRALGVEVDAMIGAPGGESDPRLREVVPASRLHVLEKLMQGGFDILHYAGHGAWDDRAPDRTGWLFKGGILSSRELDGIDLAPRLIVANACLSGGLSTATRGGASPTSVQSEAHLLPGLADEFFRRGVRNYIGTAWEINDLGAIEFSTKFYEVLLAGKSPGTIGEALLAARKALFGQAEKYGSLWAAYQHYGDPSARIMSAQGTRASGGDTSVVSRPRRSRQS